MNLEKWLKKAIRRGILGFLPVALLASGADAALLWGIRSFMELLSGASPFSMGEWVLVMVLLTALRFVFLFWKVRVSERWVYAVGSNVTGWFLRKLRSLSPKFFHDPQSEAAVETAFESTQVLQNNGSVFFQAIQAVLQLVVFLPVLFFISWPLTMFLFVVVVPMVAWMQRKIHAMGPEEETLLMARSKFRTDLNGARRLFRSWSSSFEREQISSDLMDSTRELKDRNLRFSIRKNGLSLLTETVSVLAMVLVLAFCALLISRGWMDGGGLVLFCSAVLLCYKPVKECARVMPQFRSAVSAYRILLKFGALPRKNSSRVYEDETFRVAAGDFRYGLSETAVFEKCDVLWNDKKPVLLRGKNGAGKTTLLRLVAGLEEWNSGKMTFPKRASTAGIFLMSQNLELPPRYMLRALLNSCDAISGPQFSHLQSSGSRSSSPVSAFIAKSGIQRLIEKEGLSGGERSKLGLLWALASSSRMVLLDEPLASVALADREPLLEAFLAAAAALDKWILMSSHDPLSPEMEARFQLVEVNRE